MKIVNTIGGLGNQMFCYAFALALKKRNDDDIFVDISHFNHYGLHDGFLINEIFNVKEIMVANKREISRLTTYIPHYTLSRLVRKILPKKSKEYIEKRDYVYDERALTVNGDCYFEGYWQSPLYFESIKEDVKKIFSFPIASGENKELSELIKSVNSVSIHVRRGDYLNAKSFIGICELDYYCNAIFEINSKVENPYFFIFSNDIQWCIDNIKIFLNTDRIKFVSHNIGKESFWDMYLMSCCKNMIIANSSFSWWAAYLNNNKDIKIISPSRWVNRDYDSQVHLDSWEKF
ncbi:MULTISPECIES: alpha-1,2-fucosyltransferase [unclassified Flavobacterium]|uniref:alpha-1,2-fucosyltransferase n=1 Tax=unclassified Flavobacterium TaxID=196869 RepID=UPI00131D4901|nr:MULTISPECIES: alpha-1,2-fucosyltransferase [unclassified Flavobacterium]